MKLVVSRMTKNDLDGVIELERDSFFCPWTTSMYQRELEKDDSCYLTVKADGELVGYGGILVFQEEAHVMTMAVRKGYRRCGVATFLLRELIKRAAAMGARFLTLEVRKSNRPAIELYHKFGFKVMGERKHYYMDNFENALIMWTEDVSEAGYMRLVEDLRREVDLGKREERFDPGNRDFL